MTIDGVRKYLAESGLTENEYLTKMTKLILDNWIGNETGRGLFRYAGGYWELLYPILKKYQPGLLREYEGLVGEFNYFNERVREKLDRGSEIENFVEALNYANSRIDDYASELEYHLILLDEGEDEIIKYIPNQALDQDDQAEESL